MSSCVMNTYARLPVAFVRGEGAQLWDAQENQYLDALSGIAVCNLGHAHPAVSQAISEQAACLVHTSNLYQIPLQQELARKLCELSGMDAVFFANSGAEANEAALKIARLHGHQKGYSHPQIIALHKSFHGRTLNTLSATGNPVIQEGFTPLVSGFHHVDYNDIDALQQKIAQTDQLTAIMVEPVQGEGGVNIPAKDYLQRIRALCDQHDLFMIVDEVQTGMCRTGQWFAFQHESIMPDIMTLAKGLGNGVPIGACLARGKAAEVFSPGKHGSTFGGNPLVCAAALAVINTMQESQINQRVQQLADFFTTQFQQKLQYNVHVKAIRIYGLMIGIELDRACVELVEKALRQRLLLNVTAGNVIRLLPPLIINDQQAQTIVDTVTALIEEFYL